MNNLKELHETMQKCKSCQLCNNPVVPELPEERPELIVVAERPSREDFVLNAPWFDRQFNYTQSLITPIFPSKLTYFTYLIKCYVDPFTNITKRNSKTCRELFLEKEIFLLNSKYLLTLGKTCGKLIMKENYEFGKVKLLNGMIVANWYSPTTILNFGKKREKHFIALLQEMKQTQMEHS